MTAGQYPVVVETRRRYVGGEISLGIRKLPARCGAPEDQFCIEYFDNKHLEGHPDFVGSSDQIQHILEWGPMIPEIEHSYSVAWQGSFDFTGSIYNFNAYNLQRRSCT